MQAPTVTAAPADGLPNPERRWAMLTVMLGTLLAVLDGSIANVALPSLARDLQVDAASSIWVVNAYQLSILLCLLPASSLGDIYGYRRVNRAGMAIFVLASIACMMSPSLPVLVAARFVQGIGAAGLMSINGALVRVIYPRSELGRGIGTIALVVSGGLAAGPTIAAGILSVASWHWLFAINLPIGLANLWLSRRYLPASPRQPHRFDWQSALLSMTVVGLLIGLIDGLRHGAAAVVLVTGLVVLAGLGTVLVRRQLRLPLPLLAVDLLRRPLFALSVATSVGCFSAATVGLISLPFHFEEVLGRSQVEAGLLMTPWPVLSAVTALFAGRLSDRYSVRILGCLGLAALGSGLALLAILPSHPETWNIAWRMGLCGIGFGLFQTPNNRTLMTSAPRERSGAASGMLSMARLTGQTIGAALAAVIFGAMGGTTGGTSVALLAGAGIAAVGVLVSSLRGSQTAAVKAS